MSTQPEEIIYNALIENDGYYPHQLADKIAEALRVAGLLPAVTP